VSSAYPKTAFLVPLTGWKAGPTEVLG